MRHIAGGGLILATLAVMACTDSTAPTVSIVGSYVLKTVNGSAGPPFYLSAGNGGTIQLTADTLIMDANGTYQDISWYTGSQGPTTTVETGTYSNNNGSITFYDQTDNTQYNGSLSGSVLTEITPSFTEVFQKL
jgi:hypothetical protein